MRAWLTTGLEGLKQPVLRAGSALLLAAVLGVCWAGCGPQAGGQSGGETCAPESIFSDTRIFSDDEDGGVEDDAGDAGDAAFIANTPENVSDAPRQCVPED